MVPLFYLQIGRTDIRSTWILPFALKIVVARIFGEELSAVAKGGGLYRGGTLQHWYFSAI